MSKAPFIIVPELTAIAVAYRQAGFIADLVLPRVPVNTKEFKYQKYALGDAFTVPETAVGRKGTPNQVEFGSTEVTDSVVDQALDAPVPNDDIEQWESARANGLAGSANPLYRATTGVQQLVQTRREKRAADLVFNAASYGAANKRALAGTDQWSDFVNSKPQDDIANALDSMVMRPNIAVFGRAAWSVISRHPKLCAAIYKNGTNAGTINRQQFAELFELEEVLVGDAWFNTAKKGQPATVTRLWGKKAAFLHRNMQADTDFGITFGMTAQFGGRVAGTIEDPDVGMRGGKRVRSGESVKELITADDLGFLFDTVVP
ncbi:hypothetical protein ACG04Q_11870 [Roseateles sp. DXS20W]|uniref:Phage capsid protein n=1 Tax=Pelomonas lactea TaxID=3299030 RepID=A0ABW7GJX9_9BURK